MRRREGGLAGTPLSRRGASFIASGGGGGGGGLGGSRAAGGGRHARDLRAALAVDTAGAPRAGSPATECSFASAKRHSSDLEDPEVSAQAMTSLKAVPRKASRSSATPPGTSSGEWGLQGSMGTASPMVAPEHASRKSQSFRRHGRQANGAPPSNPVVLPRARRGSSALLGAP